MNSVLGPVRPMVHGDLYPAGRTTMNLDPIPPIIPREIDWRWPVRLLLVAGIVGGGMFWWGSSRAAELDPRKRPHDLFLMERPADAAPDRNTIWRIGAGYPDRAACEKAKASVRIMRPSGTLQCHEPKVSR